MIEVTMKIEPLLKKDPVEWRPTFINPDRIEIMQQHPDDDGQTTIWIAGPSPEDETPYMLVAETPSEIIQKIAMWKTRFIR